VHAAGITDIKTRVAHPQSNGRIERLHRTHREEGLAQTEVADYQKALDAMTHWQRYYNYERPHSALAYLRPIDYYRGDPQARLAACAEKLTKALQARQAYWQQETN
jgi:transposase InsO family protein